MTEARHATESPSTSAHAHDPSHHLSPTPLLVGIGVLLLYMGIEFRENRALLGVGVVAFLGALALWVKEDVRYWRERRVDEGVNPGRDLGWWAMVMFLCTEVVLFGGLFAAFFAGRAAHPDLWAEARTHLSHALPLVTINTLILISSGVTTHYSLVNLRRGHRAAFVSLLAVTILLGLTFLGIQVSEYRQLMDSGVVLSTSFGSAFYLLTGTHAFHVATGLLYFLVVFARAAIGQFNAERHVAVDAFAIYWHFVDIVWILLYFVVYVGVI